MFTLGKEIKKIMKLQGYTLASMAEEFSKRTGKPIVGQSIKYKLEGNATLVEFMEICDILGYEVGVTPKEEGRGNYCL